MQPIVRIVLVALMLTVTAAGVWTVRANMPDSGKYSDLERLLSISKPIMVADRKAVIKHTSANQMYTNKEDFIQKARKISSRLNATDNEAMTETPEHLLYKTVSTDNHSTETTLRLIGFNDGTTQLSISIKAAHDIGMSLLPQVQNDIDTRLESLQIKPQWNAMIQGSAASAFAQPDSLYAWLTGSLPGHEVGRYQDAGSLSISYHSPVLAGPVPAAGEKETMNLQAAVHRDSLTHGQRITIGTPAISIEY
jgi:hypothetical protein